ncbi:MAG: UDP-N-acetylmuramate dehydrogenase [Cyclobacteriaceae bacterium]|nr:UDP-N-acetylmuramate dehydrogenase [Cyclobacteriaceae bacterium]UYN88328.1 MAG: UDP-N-acetylmuramate dehydrogenase [Cyclobacteriaceae bacterium]
MLAIRNNIDLKPYNTFGIHAVALHFVTINTLAELHELIHTDLFKNEKHLIIGGGSNLLLTQDFKGIIIHNNLKGIAVQKETDETITLEVSSGEPWHPFVAHCVQHDWGGIENLSLIPGTVGAAPMQNIGAYGVELCEVVDTVSGIDLKTGDLKTFSNRECMFGYRESVFKKELREKFFISSVTLTLSKKNHRLNIEYGAIKQTLDSMHITTPTIQSISEAVIAIRRKKLPDPSAIGNAGSFFKNPVITDSHYQSLKKTYSELPGYSTENQLVKVPAAWLIEHCGWKGKRFGDAGVHAHQPLVLVNYNHATGEEIFLLATRVRTSVREKFDIDLVPEVNII